MKVKRFTPLLWLFLMLMISLSLAAARETLTQPVNSTPTFTITTTGFNPTVLTTTTGVAVVWYNATGSTHVLQSGQSQRIFLPLVFKNAGGSGSSTLHSAPPVNLPLASSDTFSATLPPGGVFTHTFSLTGTHPFFLATAPQFSGQVIVQAPPGPSVSLSAAPSSGPVPLTVLFTANASPAGQAPGQTLTYTWDFGDGITQTVALTTSGPVTASRFYPIVGLYTARVTVSDGLISAGAQQLIAVNDIQPDLPPDPADVAPPLDLSVATNLFDASAFLHSGPNPIQTGVVSGTIQPLRVAVLRGKVLTRHGEALSGVTITIHDHPEYGQTLSRADGMFDLAVNGGGPLTVNYARAGYVPAQRQVQVPWQDYAWLDDVVLIPLDAHVTSVDLSSSAPMQVAQGSVISDTDGSRQATLLIEQGTQAELILPNGITQTLTGLSLRATEYTIGESGPEAMPAELPPQSGYTYAMEYSVDEALAAGATDVRFNQPLIHYVENFLDFPVGMAVPVGYYDREQAAWVPSENGRVVKILSIANDLADLDTDGDGAVDNGAVITPSLVLTITQAERQRLAGLYPSGQSLWRVPITHFTPWDCNFPYGPLPGARPPQQPPPRTGKPVADPCLEKNSIIECENQILRESVGIVGTPFSLNYASDRVAGGKPTNTLDISLSGAALPAGVKRIELAVDVAGRRFYQPFPAAPNQGYAFTWDGQDAYGRPLQGAAPIAVQIGYVYDAVYQEPAQLARAFAALSGVPLTGNRARREVTLWQRWQGEVGSWDARPLGLAAWTLDVHHVYDSGERVLYLGNGERRSAADVNLTISRAVEAWLRDPSDVAVGPDGSFYIAESGYSLIRRVGPDGVITTVAGKGYAGYSGDGGPATQALLYGPTGVAVGPDASLYIADYGNQRIRRVGPDGIITTVAGSGWLGYSGDGGPATYAGLNNPDGVAVGPDGSFYIADLGNNRIRRVGPDGIITTVAGNGTYGYGGDGGPATQAWLRYPNSLTVGPDGSLYISDAGNRRIRRVGPDGIITPVAGNGTSGYGGDGGPATQAPLNGPNRVVAGPDGSLYFADTLNHRIRRVGPDGIITTVAGSGSAGRSGDGGPATQAQLVWPRGVTVGPDGSLYLADTGNGRIRRVAPSLPGTSFADFIIPAEDGGELYVFDSRGRHLRTLDALTGAIRYQFGYDGAGRLAQVADRAGLVTRIERDAGGNPTAIVGPYGQRTTFSLDAQGYLASLTNPAGETTQFAYTPGGLLTRLTDPRGGVHNFTYDAAGRLTRDTNPAGGFIALARLFSTNGFTVTLGNALSVTTTYGVERLPAGDEGRVRIRAGGLRTETLIGANGTRAWHFPDGATQTVTLGPDPRWGMQAPPAKSQIIRTPGGLVSTIATTRSVNLADPNNALSLITLTDMVSFNGRTYTSIYDAASRTFLNTTPTGRQSTITLDALERVVQEQAANLHPDNYAYDADGRLASITQGSGAEARTLTFGYNSAGYLQTLTDSLGRTVSFNYDLAGRVTQQTLPGGRAIGFGYDANGNLTSITPPGRPAHAFTYTPVDLMETYSPPSVPGAGNNLTQYLYNAAQQLTRITRPDSQTIDFDYDSAGRLSTMTLPRGPLTYAYHPATGNLITITAPGGITLSYTYDGLLLTNSAWSGPINGSVSRAYDTDFRLTSLSVNNANPITLRYDADSLLTQAGALTLSRDPQNGLLTGTTLGNVTDTWSYNGIGEPASYSAAYAGAPMYAVQYGRDNLGRILTKTETISGLTQVYGYRYDVAGRLASVRLNSAPVATYTYDLNGNRLSYTNASSTSAGIYDNQDRLLQYGTTTYTYTANGELLSKTTGGQTTTYQYDQLANLLSVSLPDGTQIEYLIEGQNRRMGKRVNDALVQGFLYQDGLKPIAELDGSDNIVSRFVYGSQVNIPDYMVKGGVTYRIIADPLGSPRLVINTTTGQIVQRLDYDEFGNITMDTNPGFQPFGFAGGLYDPDTRLVRFGARDYDAETGRWTTKDPILFQSSDANLYAYVLNNPTTRVDPSGLDSKSRGYICGPCRDPKQAALEAVVKEMIQRVELDAYCRSGGVCISKLPRGQVSYEEFWRIVNGLSNGVQNYHAGWEGEPPEPIHDPTDEPVAPVLPPPGPTWIPPRCR